MKHTPGPWEISGLNGRYIMGPQYYNRLNHPVTPTVAIVKERIGQTEANARLIAAAPELLEASKEALRMVRNCPGNWENGVKEMLESAINKAENHRP